MPLTLAIADILTLILIVFAQIPSKSPFAAPLECMQRLLPLMEEQVASSEEVLTDLLDKLSDMVRQGGSSTLQHIEHHGERGGGGLWEQKRKAKSDFCPLTTWFCQK